MKHPLFVACIVLLSGMVSQAALAHSEHDKARFVAPDGKDTGRCDNRFRPCQTIAYAASQAGKGDRVLLAAGTYTLSDDRALFYFISELVPVVGGYSRLDHYQVQNPATNQTVLEGVPAAYAERLYNQGFQVVSDGKAGTQPAVSIAKSAIEAMTRSQSQTTCENGMAGGFPCSNISLLAHVPLTDLPTGSSTANDIWGHVDLNTQREYAIIGLRRGVAVVDVTTPTAPEVVGSISGAATTWRDIKVYQYYHAPSKKWRAYAYVTADSASEGLKIIDLNNLPDAVSLAGSTRDDVRAHNVYISNIDYTLNTALPGVTPQLHIAGSENYGGAWRSYSLDNQTAPGQSYAPVGMNRSDYTHDASSLLITDARATTDCTRATDAGCTVMLDFNEDTLRLWDHSDPASATELAQVGYPDAEYTHSGWWSEDKQYVILHDELDEAYRNLNTTVHFFDISSLSTPQLVATWTGSTKAIDHNGFVRGDRYYMSNYERGLTVLDISDPLGPREAGFFDTFPASDSNAFNGAWGVYPYLPSGTLLVSDIQGGLYILHDDTVSTEPNTAGFVAAAVSTDDNQTLNLDIMRTGSGTLTVNYEVLTGSADASDFSLESGELSWPAGDSTGKTLTIPITENTADEAEELFAIKLMNPQGGSIIPGKGITLVTINSDAVFKGAPSFEQDSMSVNENSDAFSVPVNRQGGSDGELTVTYRIQSQTAVAGEDVVEATGELRWQDGDETAKSFSISLIDDESEEDDEAFQVVLESDSDGEFSTLTVTIRDDESNLPPVVNAGGDQEVNPRANVALGGSAQDPDGSITALEWQQTEGPAVSLSSTQNTVTTFTAPDEAAELTFSFTATDEFGASTTDSVSISVVVQDNTSNPGTGNGGSSPEPVTVSEPSSSGGGSVSTGWLLLLGLFAMRRARR
ncbi:choice-of-anchor B family protein [Alteromonas sp. CYL-A6]|uniref:choice-of-anchor B family protein n=1 Tax=Alteromonas nitratireducens TaxID=3390813 RepID=UPI0034B92E21